MLNRPVGRATLFEKDGDDRWQKRTANKLDLMSALAPSALAVAPESGDTSSKQGKRLPTPFRFPLFD